MRCGDAMNSRLLEEEDRKQSPIAAERRSETVIACIKKLDSLVAA
ncbi:hypothetical protein A2U01_0105243, partial [Trifolium medium]|nr:hypothetical protein [Trifolium medium]